MTLTLRDFQGADSRRFLRIIQTFDQIQESMSELQSLESKKMLDPGYVQANSLCALLSSTLEWYWPNIYHHAGWTRSWDYTSLGLSSGIFLRLNFSSSYTHLLSTIRYTSIYAVYRMILMRIEVKQQFTYARRGVISQDYSGSTTSHHRHLRRAKAL